MCRWTSFWSGLCVDVLSAKQIREAGVISDGAGWRVDLEFSVRLVASRLWTQTESR